MILFFNRRELRYSVWEANFSLFYVCSVIWNDRGLLWLSHYSEFKILIPNVQLSKAFTPCALWRNKRQNFLASEQQFISSVQSWKLVLKHELNVWKEERKKERKNTDSSVQDRHSCLVSDSLGPGPRSAEVFIIAEDSNYSTVLLLNSQVRDEIQESKPKCKKSDINLQYIAVTAIEQKLLGRHQAVTQNWDSKKKKCNE